MLTIALAHLLARGVQLTTHEAVALAQELLGRASGIPSPQNIFLAADGSGSCVDEGGAPSVKDIAGLLHELLPAGTAGVPAPLRYAIARGLQAVEAPPYETLADLSHALQRFEGGERREVLRGLLQRVTRAPRSLVVPAKPEPSLAATTPLAPVAAGANIDLPRSQAIEEPRPPRPLVAVPRRPEVAPQPSPPAPAPVASPAPIFVANPPLMDPEIHVVPVAKREPRTDRAPLFASIGSAPSPVAPSRRNRRLVAAAAVLASFAVGFGVMDLLGEPGDASDSRTRVENGPTPAGTVRGSKGVASTIGRTPGAKPVWPSASALPTASPAAPLSGAPAAPSTAAPGTAGAAGDPTSSLTAPASEESVADDRKAIATGGRVERVTAVSDKYPAAFSPAFAANGTAIFFHTGGARDSRSAIEVATSGEWPGGDLGIMTVVDDGSRNYHAQPSPDGRFVAFDSDRDGERGIYVANRDGSQVHRVSGDGYAAAPTWSRDGDQLAYIRAEIDNASVWNLWVQPASGGTARRVTSHKYGQTWAASWFPDSHHICYTHDDKIYVLDLLTGQAKQFDSPVKGRAVRTPAVSPDGAKVIFQVYRHGAWMLDLRDGSMQCVLTDPTAEEFAWAPDGLRVAFHSRRDGRWGIYVLSRG
ncbi:MAG: hypothetical protein ABIQ52_10130 [Vicinamibacterales bacterium]